jgi:NIPSNAP
VKRRTFVASSLAAAVPTLKAAGQGAGGSKDREYYELRKYHLQSGPQQKLLDTFLAEALIPALNRLGMKPVGAFNLYLGPETPSLYLLIPSNSLDTLATAELKLAQDEEFLRRGEPFLNAPAKEPPYERIESSLSIAFEGWPKLVVPPVTAQKGARVFQLRTYESPSFGDHRRKVEMFHKGEFGFFEKAGFWQVFFGDTLIGPRLPNLTYMLSMPSLAELNGKWDAFNAIPEWKTLRTSPRYAYEPIVSNVTNLILNPASYSQI